MLWHLDVIQPHSGVSKVEAILMAILFLINVFTALRALGSQMYLDVWAGNFFCTYLCSVHLPSWSCASSQFLFLWWKCLLFVHWPEWFHVGFVCSQQQQQQQLVEKVAALLSFLFHHTQHLMGSLLFFSTSEFNRWHSFNPFHLESSSSEDASVGAFHFLNRAKSPDPESNSASVAAADPEAKLLSLIGCDGGCQFCCNNDFLFWWVEIEFSLLLMQCCSCMQFSFALLVVLLVSSSKCWLQQQGLSKFLRNHFLADCY